MRSTHYIWIKDTFAFLLYLSTTVREAFTYKCSGALNTPIILLFIILTLFHIIFHPDYALYFIGGTGAPQLVACGAAPIIKGSQLKTPVFPHTPVKVYNSALESKLEISRDFRGQTIIYMWFNKITGKVYIGSGVDGSLRLSRYFLPSVLKSNSRIYKNILKYGHDSFSVCILEVVGKTGSVSKPDYLAREQFYLDWALKTYGLLVLNLLTETSSSLGFKHSLDTKERIAEFSRYAHGLKHSELTKQKLREMFTGEKNPF